MRKDDGGRRRFKYETRRCQTLNETNRRQLVHENFRHENLSHTDRPEKLVAKKNILYGNKYSKLFVVRDIMKTHNLIPVLSSPALDRKVRSRKFAHPPTVRLLSLVLLDQVLGVLGQLQELNCKLMYTGCKLLTTIPKRVHRILRHEQQSQQ